MNTNSETLASRRLDTVDIAKGIGIIFVVFAHVNYTPELLVLIYSFHMPLFFIISGMLFRRDRFENFGAFLRRRWKTLILPYLLFSLLTIGYLYLSERLFPELYEVSRAEYLAYFVEIFLARGSAPVLNTPLWFVPCLLAVEILYYFLSSLKPAIRIPLCVLLAGIGWLLESGLLTFDNTLLPWSLDSALFALSFYAFGNLSAGHVKSAVEKLRNHPRKLWLCLGIIALCIALWLPATLANGKVSLGSKVLNNGFLFFLTGILGTAIILAVSILVGRNRFLTFCGQNSFVIMASHYVIRRYTLPKYYALLDIPMYHRRVFCETFIPFLIILTLSLVFTFLYSRITKKRNP